MVSRGRLITASIIGLILILVLAYALRAPRPRANISIGTIGRSTATSLVYAYGIEKGIYEKYNLNVSHISYRDVYTIYLNLFTGKIDTVASSPGRISTAYNDGEAIKICIALAESYDFALVVKPGISQLEDLKSRRIGVMGMVTDAYNILKWYCEGKGLDLEEDFEIVEIKSPASLVTSFLTGDVEAVAVWGAYEGEVIDGGGVVLMTFSEALEETIGVTHYMNLIMIREGLIEDEKVLNNYLKATKEIVVSINENREEAAKIWATFAGESEEKMSRALDRMRLVGEMNDDIEAAIMAFFEKAAQEGYLERAPGEEIFYKGWK